MVYRKEIKMNKRIVIVSIFILIISVILSGCNSNKKNNQSYSDNTSAVKNIEENIKPEATEQPQTNEKPIILYGGISLDNDDLEVDALEGLDEVQSQRILAKYEREYYLYSNNKFLGKAKGKVEGRGMDYYWQVSFPTDNNQYEVAISQSYNPYPRGIIDINPNSVKEFYKNGKVLTEINKKFSVNSNIRELSSIDLDSDGTSEYIAFVLDEKKYFFARCLLDSHYNIISYLTVFMEKCDNFNEITSKNNLLDTMEVIDIDNDGMLEIIIEFPFYEGFEYKVFAYKNGTFNGDFINQCSLQP
jgi:hypothetical protein